MGEEKHDEKKEAVPTHTPIVYDKEERGDHVTVQGAPRTAKSFNEPPWGK